MRVHELAKECKIESKWIIQMLHLFDIEVKNHMSTIGEKELKELKKFLSPQKGESNDFSLLNHLKNVNCISFAINNVISDKGYYYLGELFVEKKKVEKKIKVIAQSFSNYEYRKVSEDNRQKLSIEILQKLASFYIDKFMFALDMQGFFLNNNFEHLKITNYVVHKNNFEVRSINSISEYLDIIKLLDKNKCDKLLYRGHSKISYELIPSLFRIEEIYNSEKQLYNELLNNCISDFNNISSKIDYLVEMQHYAMPTRLLDVTENPLVALYFACITDEETCGEIICFNISNEDIYYPNDDIIELLSALPLLNKKEKEILYKAIQEENNTNFKKQLEKLVGYINKLGIQRRINKNDLLNNVFVMPRKNNARILKQEGMFIIFGLEKRNNNNNINAKRVEYNGKTLILMCQDKTNIIKELDLIGINKAALFPEIEYRSIYLKNKYNIKTSTYKENEYLFSDKLIAITKE